MSKLLAQPTDLGDFSPIGRFGENAANSSPTAGPLQDLESIVSTSIGVLTVVAGLFFIIYFFMAALKWLTAGGDSGKVSKARDEMVQGVMGLIVIVAAYGIIGIIGTILGLQLLQPAAQIQQIFDL